MALFRTAYPAVVWWIPSTNGATPVAAALAQSSTTRFGHRAMTEVFTYLYDNVTENLFSQTSSTHAIRDLITNDTSKQIDIISIMKFSR